MRRESNLMLAHLLISPGGLDFLVLTKRIAASGNEIVLFSDFIGSVRMRLRSFDHESQRVMSLSSVRTIYHC